MIIDLKDKNGEYEIEADVEGAPITGWVVGVGMVNGRHALLLQFTFRDGSVSENIAIGWSDIPRFCQGVMKGIETGEKLIQDGKL